MNKKSWWVLDTLKEASAESLEKIKTTENREDLIDEVMRLRGLKRAEIVCKNILDESISKD